MSSIPPSNESHSGGNSTISQPMHVLIIGGGIVGLVIAQGCRENGIPFTVFEQDEKGSREQGWAVTLHWCLPSLERTIGPVLSALVPGAVVDKTLSATQGNFLFFNAATGEPRYNIPPNKRRLRLNRQKFRALLSTGLDVQEGKRLASVETLANGGVKAHFTDGSNAIGSLLIGADGNNSVVRKHLLGEQGNLNLLPVNMIGVVRHFTPEQAAPVRALDPLLFLALHPDTQNFLWYSVQDVFKDPDGRNSYDALCILSWLVENPEKDAIPTSNVDRIAMMKQRADAFAEPFRSIFADIPDDLDITTPIRLADFPCIAWNNSDGRITLAGDSAHAMTMYRGEAANHGILDAALLLDQLKRMRDGEIGQKAGIDLYEAEQRPRTHAAVLKSRQACLDAHVWEKITDGSPLIGARSPPDTA